MNRDKRAELRNKPIARGVKALRRRVHMTQSDFALEVGVSRPALGSYEEGRAEPNLKTLYRMTKVADVSIDLFCQKVFA